MRDSSPALSRSVPGILLPLFQIRTLPIFHFMLAPIKKIHMYIGLLNFSNLIVFGIAGLAATFQSEPERSMSAGPVRYESFMPAPGSTDEQIADAVFVRFHFPFTDPVPKWAIHRDAQGDLPLEFWSVNGVHRVLYSPKENRLRIETRRVGVPFFIDGLHTVNSLEQRDWRMRVWAWYNNFAIWSLMAMAISGVYLWLASRPGYRIAQYSFAGGAGVFILLYALTR
ncbi:MAG: hypothetical protein JWO48_3485 [Bryobacterales bacterium]|nr:hypothetical protein [Bryobacterales bacterium]